MVGAEEDEAEEDEAEEDEDEEDEVILADEEEKGKSLAKSIICIQVEYRLDPVQQNVTSSNKNDAIVYAYTSNVLTP